MFFPAVAQGLSRISLWDRKWPNAPQQPEIRPAKETQGPGEFKDSSQTPSPRPTVGFGVLLEAQGSSKAIRESRKF